jgi:hypothetical protein
MSGVRLLSESHDSMWSTCWYYHVSCTTSVDKSRQHVTNMLMFSCLVCDFCRKVMTACDQHVNVIMCRVWLLSESDGSMWTTCWYYHISCTTSVGKSRQHVTNMLMLSCLVYDFCRKVTTACDQHGNVIMSGVRLLSESHDSMWPTCWYYHVSCTTSVGKSRQHVTNMLMLSCLVCHFCRKVMTACDQHVNVIMCRVRLLSESVGSMRTTYWYYHISCKTSVGKSRQHVNNMLMLSCLVCDFCPKVMTACDQHVDIIMSRVRLLSENHDSMWPTC